MKVEDIPATRGARPVSTLTALAGQPGEVDRVRAFWRRVERFPAGAQLRLAEGSAPDRQVVIVSGWACELRILKDGRRQIFGFLLPGDAIDARATVSIGTRAVVALTRLEVIDARNPLGDDPAGRDSVTAALEDAALRREERLYDHLVRIGRLTAKERVVHLLLELLERLEMVGLAKGDSFRIPLTQEMFADALGLSVVHINRTLKQLRQEGLVTFRAGSVTLCERQRLTAMVDFQPRCGPLAARPVREAATAQPTSKATNFQPQAWAVA